MIRFVLSFVALLVSSFLFIWSMHEFVSWGRQIFLMLIALGSMGIFFSCFSVFSFFQQRPFPGETQEGFSETSSLWWLSALVFSLALIIGITLIIFDRNNRSNTSQIVQVDNQNASGQAIHWSEKEIVSLEWINATPPNPLNEGGHEKLSMEPLKAEITKSHITTFVSSERQNIKIKPVQKIVSKRQYLTDGTPIPYEGERIFVIYESKH